MEGKKKRLPRDFLRTTLVRTRGEDTHRARGPTRHLGVWRCLRWDARWIPGEKAQRRPSPLLVPTGPTAPGELRTRFIANERNPSVLFYVLGKGGGASVESDDLLTGPGPLPKFPTLSMKRRLQCVHWKCANQGFFTPIEFYFFAWIRIEQTASTKFFKSNCWNISFNC